MRNWCVLDVRHTCTEMCKGQFRYAKKKFGKMNLFNGFWYFSEWSPHHSHTEIFEVYENSKRNLENYLTDSIEICEKVGISLNIAFEVISNQCPHSYHSTSSPLIHYLHNWSNGNKSLRRKSWMPKIKITHAPYLLHLHYTKLHIME